jgi:hypothetical protein
MRPHVFIVIGLLAMAACGSPTEVTYTCEGGVPIEEDQDLELQDLFHGTYNSRSDVRGAARGCFSDGYEIGIAEMACSIIRVIDDPGSGYKLSFTDEDGYTEQVLIGDHLRLGDGNELSSFARRRYVSACPDLVEDFNPEG